MEPEKKIDSPDTERDERVPPGQSLRDDFPVLQHGSIPSINTSNWTFRVRGLVERERILGFTEFTSLQMTRVHADIHCVTGWSKLDTHWEGVSTAEIKRLARILPEARAVMVHCEGGYTTNLPLDDFFQPDVLFAIKYEGEPLTPEHGYPVRLVVPRLYLWKSAKWVNGIAFMKEDTPGFWESQGYHIHGDPWIEERYS